MKKIYGIIGVIILIAIVITLSVLKNNNRTTTTTVTKIYQANGITGKDDVKINGGTINVTGSSTFDYDGNAEFTGGTIIIIS